MTLDEANVMLKLVDPHLSIVKTASSMDRHDGDTYRLCIGAAEIFYTNYDISDGVGEAELDHMITYAKWILERRDDSYKYFTTTSTSDKVNVAKGDTYDIR